VGGDTRGSLLQQNRRILRRVDVVDGDINILIFENIFELVEWFDLI
jgi:hypothetical protein